MGIVDAQQAHSGQNRGLGMERDKNRNREVGMDMGRGTGLCVYNPALARERAIDVICSEHVSAVSPSVFYQLLFGHY